MSKNYWGSSWDFPTIEEARSRALRECKTASGSNTCRIIDENVISAPVVKLEEWCLYGPPKNALVRSTLEACDTLVARQPNNASAYNNRAVFYESSGDLDKALKDYERAVRLNDSNIDNRNIHKQNLGRLREIVKQQNEIASMPSRELCSRALSADDRQWATMLYYAADVSEARHRGLSVEDCREALGLPRTPKLLAEFNPAELCAKALNSENTDWGFLDQHSSFVVEASRREFSLADCRIAVGLPPKSDVEPSIGGSSELSSSDTSSRRVALVIGNANYRSVSWLANPDDDARGISDALASLGFKVIRVVDGSLSEMRSSIVEFAKMLQPDTQVALVYFSGHAVEVGSINYLLPVDIKATSGSQIEFYSVSVAEIVKVIASRRVPTKVLILDACRNNPLNASAGGGLAPVVAPSGTIIAYSTAPGAVAVDGDEKAGNSPYTGALLEALRKPAETIEETFKEVRTTVIRITDEEQVPWENSSLVTQVSFAKER